MMGKDFEVSEKAAGADGDAPAELLSHKTTQPKANDLEISHAALDLVHAAEEEFTPDQYRKLLWKIDLVILPLMWVSSAQRWWAHNLSRCRRRACSGQECFLLPIEFMSLIMSVRYAAASNMRTRLQFRLRPSSA